MVWILVSYYKRNIIFRICKSQDAWIYSRNILSYQFIMKGKAGIFKYSSTDVALEVFHLENHLLTDPPISLWALFVDLNVLIHHMLYNIYHMLTWYLWGIASIDDWPTGQNVNTRSVCCLCRMETICKGVRTSDWLRLTSSYKIYQSTPVYCKPY